MTELPRQTNLSMLLVVALSLFGCAMSPTHTQVMRTSIDSSGAVTVYEVPGPCEQALVNEARRKIGMDVSTSMISCAPVRRSRAEGAGGSAGRE